MPNTTILMKGPAYPNTGPASFTATPGAGSLALAGRTPQRTALQQAADLLSPGEWGEVQNVTQPADGVLWNSITVQDDIIFEFGDKAIYDPIARRINYYGSDDPLNLGRTHMYYDEDLNSFGTETAPGFSNVVNHSYHQHAIDRSRGRMYYKPQGGNNAEFGYFTFATNTWTLLGGAPGNGSNTTWGLCEFPDIDRLIGVTNHTSGGNLVFYDYNPATDVWSSLTDTSRANSNEQTCKYLPIQIPDQSDKGCVIVGHGIGSDLFGMITPDLTYTALDDYPGANNAGASTVAFMADWASGKLLCIVGLNGTLGSQFWELDPTATATNQWTRLNSGVYANAEGGGPMGDSGRFTGDTFMGCSADMPYRGFSVFIGVRNPSGNNIARVWVYKHIDTLSPDELFALPESSTHRFLDFETVGRCVEAEMCYIGGQGNLAAFNSTTDPGTTPNRKYRDHPNYAGFNSSDFPISALLSLQEGCNMPWQSRIHTPNNSSSDPGGVYHGPEIVSGEGEFEGFSSITRSCLKLTTRGSTAGYEDEFQAQKASGDFVIPLRRNQGTYNSTTPFTYYVFGEGAEFWVRYWLKTSALYLSTLLDTATGVAEGKRSIIAGKSSSQTLEETLQEESADRTYAAYSNSGSDPYTASTRPYTEQGVVVHQRVVVGDNAGRDNGIYQLFLDNEQTALVEELAATHDVVNLVTGLITNHESVGSTEVGYIQAILTNFCTEKSETQVHSDLETWYDNVAITAARCPPLVMKF